MRFVLRMPVFWGHSHALGYQTHEENMRAPSHGERNTRMRPFVQTYVFTLAILRMLLARGGYHLVLVGLNEIMRTWVLLVHEVRLPAE